MEPAQNTPERPVPWVYEDYRDYLRAMVVHLKKTQPTFSYRYFARKAGFKTSNFLKLVADGKRNISYESIGRFAKGLDLTKREHEAFEALVLFAQATGETEKRRYLDQLLSRGARRDPVVKLRHEQLDAFSKWYALPLKELLTLRGSKDDPDWLSRHLRPGVAVAKVRKALEVLERAGHLVRDLGDKLRPPDTATATAAVVPSLAVRAYHRAMLHLAAKALDELPMNMRSATSLTIALSREEYEEVCERIDSFRLELLEDYGSQKTRADRRIYFAGFPVIPVSEKVPS